MKRITTNDELRAYKAEVQTQPRDLIVTLAGIHPDLGAWAQERREDGMYDADILARLKTIAYTARPEGDDKHADAFAVTTLISARMVADLFVTAIESGISYWCDGVYAKGWKKADANSTLWYDDTAYVTTDRLHFEVHTSDGEEKIVKGREAIERGLAVLSAKYPHHMKDIVDDNHDASTADNFFQCVVFGDIIYG